MFGSRALNQDEIDKIVTHFDQNQKKYDVRNQALIMVGLSTGFRISELLSIKAEDILKSTNPIEINNQVTVQKRNLKGGKTKKNISSRTVPLNNTAKTYLKRLIEHYNRTSGALFLSQKPNKDGEFKQITPQHAGLLFRKIREELGLDGKVSTHSLRKTFAKKVYEKTNESILDTQAALGHTNINSTVQYLRFNNKRVYDAIMTD